MTSDPDIGDARRGMYVEAGCFFTGESFPYVNGVFANVVPTSDMGAWQLVLRYDAGDGECSDVELGEIDAQSLSVSLNYYANKHVKIAASYSYGEEAKPVNNTNENNGEEFRLRAQFVF
ncbi:MAG: phosphate-selective porin [Lentisphaeria bacterium]|jgi:phosphate-selective porin